VEEREFDYINVIPLVDVMLVLLTIVLTTSTFIAAGVISVSLPKASHSRAEVLERQTIAIDYNGVIYFNTAKVTLEELAGRIRNMERDTPILIRADRETRLQAFVDVLDLLNSRSFKKVAIQTERKG